MPAPVTPIILIGLASFLATLVLLFGIQWICAALLAAILRRRYPTPAVRRAYLLRGTARYLPELSDTQRLEKIREAGTTVAYTGLGMPTIFLNQLMCGWMGLPNHLDENMHRQILWLGLGCSLLFPVLLGPWLVARGRLAREILRAPVAAFMDSAGEALTFWPHLGPDRLR